MTETALAPATGARDEMAIMERVLAVGDLRDLTPAERCAYYNALCHSLKLNPLSRPFEYVEFDRRLQLYARKDCADQLRRIHSVSIVDVKTEQVDTLYVVTVTARDSTGRIDIDQGVVETGTLRGQVLANAWMKAVTKGKRRVTLSLCGLGIVDESEIESIPNARNVRVDDATGEILEPPAALPPATATMPPAPRQPVPQTAQPPGATVCTHPSCATPLNQAQYNLSVRGWGVALCPKHQRETPRLGAAPAPTPPPADAAEMEVLAQQWQDLVDQAEAANLDISRYRPEQTMNVAEIQALLLAARTIVEGEAAKRQEAAA